MNKEIQDLPSYNLQVDTSPHLRDNSVTTAKVMYRVLIGLIPILGWSFYLFGWDAVKVVGLSLIASMGCDALFSWIHYKKIHLYDGSAAITGIILGLSLPAGVPWYIPIIAGAVGIGLGKSVFGGLGCNIFNPAMVGRAFVMLSFAKELGASAYQIESSQILALTQPTPLTSAKALMEAVFKGKEVFHHLDTISTSSLFIGYVNGALGEVSALCILIGGSYLLITNTASWQIPLGSLVGLILITGPSNWLGLTPFTVLQHILAGAFLLGAFFIATDPVTSPLSPWGRFWFGVGFGLLAGVIRIFSNYPEGVMFAILMMNGLVPLINRVTIPNPVGTTKRP